MELTEKHKELFKKGVRKIRVKLFDSAEQSNTLEIRNLTNYVYECFEGKTDQNIYDMLDLAKAIQVACFVENKDCKKPFIDQENGDTGLAIGISDDFDLCNSVTIQVWGAADFYTEFDIHYKNYKSYKEIIMAFEGFLISLFERMESSPDPDPISPAVNEGYYKDVSSSCGFGNRYPAKMFIPSLSGLLNTTNNANS